MMRRQPEMGSIDFDAALRALQGAELASHERVLALRFLTALPSAPATDEGVKDLSLARALAVSVLRPVYDIIETALSENRKLAVGDGGRAWRAHRAALLAAGPQSSALVDSAGRLWGFGGYGNRSAFAEVLGTCLKTP